MHKIRCSNRKTRLSNSKSERERERKRKIKRKKERKHEAKHQSIQCEPVVTNLSFWRFHLCRRYYAHDVTKLHIRNMHAWILFQRGWLFLSSPLSFSFSLCVCVSLSLLFSLLSGKYIIKRWTDGAALIWCWNIFWELFSFVCLAELPRVFPKPFSESFISG